MRKVYQEKNVYEATMERLEYIFNEFENVLVSFSGGKDSGVLLNLAYNYAKSKNRLNDFGFIFSDYEAGFQETFDFVGRVFEKFECGYRFWLCLPSIQRSSVDIKNNQWVPWLKSRQYTWCRDMPNYDYVVNEGNADFKTIKKMNNTHRQRDILEFFIKKHADEKKKKTAVLIGIRADESLHRTAVLTNEKRTSFYKNIRWSRKQSKNCFAFYPLYDWQTKDIWVANGKFGFDYNRTYDLFYKKGLKISEMRIAMPFNQQASSSLKLFKVLDPQMYNKMIARTDSVNFVGVCGGTKAMATGGISLPINYKSWKEYADFLLNTIPINLAEKYKRQFNNLVNSTDDDVLAKSICTAIFKNRSTLENLEKNKSSINNLIQSL